MKNWPQVDQLDDAEKPESLDYIRIKYGAYKINMKKAKTFIYFKCPKNTCEFQMRLEKRSGALQALHEHNHSMEEISSADDQLFQTDLEVWRKVDQLDEVEKPESLAYIRNKYGVYKLTDKRNAAQHNFIYFHCTEVTSKTCKFKLRWDKRSGTLEALYEHNHSIPLEPLPDKLLTNENKDATQKEVNKKINKSSAVPPIAKNSVPKKKNIQKPANGGKKPKKGEMPKKVPFLSHEEARRIMMGFKPTKVSKEDKRGRE